ncbi:MAG: DUF882 domain-containing protein [Lachnospiraceae bacterium]|nr:DUF882 domain-containing protein [Lachnospiraceae bacterium]
MVKEFSLKKDGELKLSENFKVKEFACRDGSDKLLADLLLVDKLQGLRNFTDKPVIIPSAYRTESYNKQCGGATNSYHLSGMAADVYCDGVSPIVIALWAEFNGLGGIGVYLNRDREFVHLDTRPTKYRWVNRNGTNQPINSILDLVKF